MTEHDHDNATFASKRGDVFDADGRIKAFQRRKYEPSLKRMQAAGVGHDAAILDVGVGYGCFLALLKELGYTNTLGMDPFPVSIEIATEMSGAEIRNGRIEDMDWPIERDSMDAITCFDVIEHLEEPAVFFRNVINYVRPGGLVLATTPLKLMGYRLRGLPVLGRPDTNPTHINVHPPKYWLDLVAQSDFELVEQWRGENLTHVKYIHWASKLTDFFGLDHRKVPGLNVFEQSFLMLLRRPA